MAILIQVARNKLWIKNSQATRVALNESPGNRNLMPILLYTLANTSLYILSILVILGGNLIVLFCILLGNMIGVFMSLSKQDADKEHIAMALLHIKCRWNYLVVGDYEGISNKKKVLIEKDVT